MGGRHRFASLPQSRFYDLILLLDEVDPGFAGWAMRLGSVRQQIVFAVLAKAGGRLLSLQNTIAELRDLVRGDHERLFALTQNLLRCRGRDLIEAHYGSCPSGLLGSLAKTDGGPQPTIYYTLLHAILSDPAQKPLANFIRQLRRLDHQRLNVMRALDPLFLSHRFVEKVGSVRQAEDLRVALRLIRKVVGSDATDEALRHSIKDVSAKATIADWVGSWLRRARNVRCPPLDLGPEWIALTSAPMMIDAGHRLSLCLGSTAQILRALRGEVNFYECPHHRLIAEVKPIGPERRLILVDVHGMNNGYVRDAVRRKVHANLLAAGVPHLNWGPADCLWGAVGRLVCEVAYLNFAENDGQAALEDHHDDLEIFDELEAA